MGPESARDQCNKEGCNGCSNCSGSRDTGNYYRPAKSITEASMSEIRCELRRRREERKKISRNATKQNQIKALQAEIRRLEKELE